MRKIYQNRLLIVFIIFLIVLFPSSLSKKSMSNNNAIVIAVGIDKEDEKYTLSFQVVIPKQNNSFRESLLVLSSSGENLYDIYKKAETQIGKRIAFRHCQYIIVNEELAKTEDMTKMCDFLTRNKDISNSCILLCTDKSANEIMTLDSKTESSISIGIIEMLESYEKKYFVYDTNLENFVVGTYSPRKCGLMTYITTTENIDEGIGSTSEGGGSGGSSDEGGGSGGGSGGGGQSKEKYLSFDGRAAVFRKAKYVGLFSSDDLLALNWFNKSSGVSDKFTIENVTDELYTEAKIGLELLEKKSKVKAYFEGGVPIVSVDVDLKVIIEDVENAIQDKNVVQSGRYSLTTTLAGKMKERVYSDCKNILAKMVEYKADIIDIYSMFNKYHHKEFQDYLSSLKEDEFYLSKVKVVVNSNVTT